MSVVDATTRAAIEERAGFRCEYCRLPVRGQIATFPIDHPSIATSDKGSAHMRIGYVEEVAPVNVGRGDFQHCPIPVDSAAEFGVEIVPETQDRGSGWNVDAANVIDAAANPIVIGEEKVIGRCIRVNVRDPRTGTGRACG